LSQKLPAIKSKDLPRALKRAGFYIHHVSGSHYVLKHADKTALRVTLPWHSRDLKRGTLNAILEQAEMSPDELSGLL
jgi:predicted RNA binding protein YcfA (HicA-like mRNA interferase family)